VFRFPGRFRFEGRFGAPFFGRLSGSCLGPFQLGIRPLIADLDFEALELAARRQALRLAARALERRLNMDTSNHMGPRLPCPCGGSAQYHGRHGKTFESVLGPLHLQRAYYHCEQCASGFCPRDRALGLELFSLTPGVLRMTASATALLSFEESSGLHTAPIFTSLRNVQIQIETLPRPNKTRFRGHRASVSSELTCAR
jgi:hypothetical protein